MKLTVKRLTQCILLSSVLISGISHAVNLPAVKEYIDLNHPLESGMQTYPGLSEVETYDKAPRFSNGALIDGIKMLGIPSTYIDAPYHVDPHGGKVADYKLEQLVNLPIVVIPLPEGHSFYAKEDIEKYQVRGKTVLLFTGKSRYFGTPEYSKNPPYISTAAAEWLAGQKAALVGIDALLVDNYNQNDTTPVHDVLLKNGVVIAEDMTNLGALAGKDARLTAVPPRAPLASFPTRIFATVY